MSHDHHPHRRSPRLKGFDYHTTAGYVLTICTAQRRPLFGHIANGRMDLSAIGAIVDAEWRRTGEMRSELILDQYVVMPNHLHGIVILQGNGTNVASMVAGFKASVTRQAPLVAFRGEVWQRSFYDHIIRNDDDLARCSTYIENNVLQWELDRYHPNREPR